jgi:hypothetical protein
MSDGPKQCPECRSPKVAPILYGLPAPGLFQELMRKADSGEIVLGGCVVTGNDPTWHCVGCGHRWGNKDKGARRERRRPG